MNFFSFKKGGRLFEKNTPPKKKLNAEVKKVNLKREKTKKWLFDFIVTSFHTITKEFKCLMKSWKEYKKEEKGIKTKMLRGKKRVKKQKGKMG